jgi:hypothetical protein
MRALVGVAAAVLTLFVADAVASAVGPAAHDSQVPAGSTVALTSQVGPDGAPATPAAQVPTSSGGASQVVSGVTQSTSAVRFTNLDEPVYYGTEPAQMTVARSGAELVVTVAPR